MLRLLSFSLFSILFFGIPYADAKVEKGNVRSKTEDWIFISNFCFDTNGIGNLTWTGWSVDDTHLLLLYYDDEKESWPTVWDQRHSLTCQQKVQMAKNYSVIIPGLQSKESFRDVRRPHYWYIVISNCGGQNLEFEYNLEFLNAGGYWTRQFSYDAQGLNTMYLFFWLLFMIGSAVHLKGVWVLYRHVALHPIVRILTGTIILETFSLLSFFIHYAIYTSDGIGASGMKGLGEVLDMTSQLMLMFLLILIAKGWAITRNEVTGKKVTMVVISLFLLGYLTMFIWENVGRNPASTLYIYESIPGILILVLRGLTLIWFLFSLRQSHVDEIHPDKRRFYFLFGQLFAIWFLLLPLIVIIASFLAAWYRLKVVTALYLVMNTLALATLGFFFWPSRATVYFSISKPDGLLGPSTSDVDESL